MGELLGMGPPLYWVLSTKLPLHKIPNQNLICGGQRCNSDSVLTKLYLASTSSEMYVANPNYL